MDDSLVDKIANSCLDLYKKLPKTGKPVEHEWTVLSCVVQYEPDQDRHMVVSLGTGSKCIGASKMCSAGNVLNDSHAEVIARRGFLVYVYENIENALRNKESIFIFEHGTFKLRTGIEFIFYSSQTPCGDASIMPKNIDEEYGDVIRSNKRSADNDTCDVESKKIKLELVDDIHRTGAKCLPTAEQDSKESGAKYHTVGQVRTKPGRGDVTLSVSCSDKIARWIHVGIQGGLLDMLLAEPIYIKSFIFGADVPYSIEAIERAFLNRNGRRMTAPEVTFQQCSIAYPNKKNEENAKPAPVSIIWIRTSNEHGILEAATQGVKLGLIKKRYNLVSSYLSISKYKLYERFQRIINLNEELKLSICGGCNMENIPYNEMKNKSERYKRNWKDVKDLFFKMWTEKPDMWNFCVNNT
ncbi:tRNA-specific adenosine deaminase 1 [Epargyreus clarus]|uniref:tRNA-specific adenosine deaminase 1 n=1 Tax=Epargyreus clarus TaxID=520877 RepID=UPI003C2B717A